MRKKYKHIGGSTQEWNLLGAMERKLVKERKGNYQEKMQENHAKPKSTSTDWKGQSKGVQNLIPTSITIKSQNAADEKKMQN